MTIPPAPSSSQPGDAPLLVFDVAGLWVGRGRHGRNPGVARPSAGTRSPGFDKVACVIGLIDVGATKLLAAVADHSGPLSPVVRRATPQTEPVATLIAMLDEVRDGADLETIAMALPGPFTREPTALVNPPSMTRDWWGLDFTATLGRHYGCPVVVENDANCAALAEVAAGAGVGRRTAVYITVSTGIGTALVHNGALVYGRRDTEGGHMILWPRWLGGPACDCGGHGCLETLASGRGLRQRFGRDAVDIDDPEIWREVGRWLGLGIVSLSCVFDPECVIMGGGVCNAWDRFAPTMLRVVRDELHLVEVPDILRAELGEERNLIGALTLVR